MESGRTGAVVRTVGLVVVALGIVYLVGAGSVDGDQALEVLGSIAALIAGGAGVGLLWSARRGRGGAASQGGLAELPPPARTLPPAIPRYDSEHPDLPPLEPPSARDADPWNASRRRLKP